jgi:hypothetical protein
MALYVAICLLAAFAALPETGVHAHVIGIIWGVTIGLALAHWFAFRVSARMVGAGSVRPHDVESAGAQLAGAAGWRCWRRFPCSCFLPRLSSSSWELLLAAFIALVRFAVARGGGATRGRAMLYGLAVLVVAVAIALVKNGPDLRDVADPVDAAGDADSEQRGEPVADQRPDDPEQDGQPDRNGLAVRDHELGQ